MFALRSQLPAIVLLLVGIFTGWGLASLRTPPIYASAGDRAGESIVASGPVIVRWDETVKGALPTDALYFLDYKRGKLLATVPTFQQSTGSTRILEHFSERDLVADFKLDVDSGVRPKFAMTTASLGANNVGWAPLYVFETTTSQLAVYRMQIQQTIGKPIRPHFDLVELRKLAKDATPAERPLP
jgi:hypothetical protein